MRVACTCTHRYVACERGNTEVAKVLVEFGANIDYVNPKNGASCVLTALRNHHEAIVWLLAEKGALLDAVDNDGRTLLGEACTANNPALVGQVLDFGAGPDVACAYVNPKPPNPRSEAANR